MDGLTVKELEMGGPETVVEATSVAKAREQIIAALDAFIETNKDFPAAGFVFAASKGAEDIEMVVYTPMMTMFDLLRGTAQAVTMAAGEASSATAELG